MWSIHEVGSNNRKLAPQKQRQQCVTILITLINGQNEIHYWLISLWCGSQNRPGSKLPMTLVSNQTYHVPLSPHITQPSISFIQSPMLTSSSIMISPPYTLISALTPSCMADLVLEIHYTRYVILNLG